MVALLTGKEVNPLPIYNNTCYSFVSDGVMQLYGVSPQEVIADPVALRRFRHPDDAERVDRVVQAAGRPVGVAAGVHDR